MRLSIIPTESRRASVCMCVRVRVRACVCISYMGFFYNNRKNLKNTCITYDIVQI